MSDTKILCNHCKIKINKNKFNKHKCIVNFDWNIIQYEYNKGLTCRDINNKFHTNNNLLKIAKLNNLFIPRSLSESNILSVKLGKRDYSKARRLEFRKAQSKEKKLFYKKYPEKHPQRILSNNREKMSYPERLVYDYLKKEHIPFEHNAPILSYFVDFLIGDIIIEIDGERWHDKEYDKNRDYKITNFLNIKIIRIPAKIIINIGPHIILKFLKLNTEDIQKELSRNLRIIKLIKIREHRKKYRRKCPQCNTFFINRYLKVVCCSSKCSTLKRNPQRKVNRPSIQQLQTDIETLPVIKIGKKYGVSNTAITKWCKSYEISTKKTLYPPKHLLEEDLKDDLPFLQIAKKYNSDTNTIKRRIKQYGLFLPKRQKNKLTESQVKEIKQKILQGACNKELSKEYKIDPNTISGIRTGISWSSVK